jgi:hypothetical protein
MCDSNIVDKTYIIKVDEGIANTNEVSSDQQYISTHLLATVSKVNSKVHEVIATTTSLVDDALQGLLINFVRDISKHDLRVLVDKLASMEKSESPLCGHQCHHESC